MKRADSAQTTVNKYSPRFTAFLPFIYQWECVYEKGHYGDMAYVTWEDVPGDNGKCTKYGIDARSHPELNIKELTEAQARQVYWESYWQKYKCDSYPAKMGECVFNCAVNCGYGRAKKILALAKSAPDFVKEQNNFYRRLVVSKPVLKKFLKGWLNRTAALSRYLRI